MRQHHSSSSLKGILIAKVRAEQPNWLHGGFLERYGMDAQYKGATVSRELRLLWEEGWLEKRYNKKGHVEYQFIPVKEQQVIFNKDNSVTIN